MKKDFTFLTDYRHDDKHRIAFSALTQKVFGITFEAWYQTGYWNEKYIPYTLFDGEKAIANVSVNIMDFNTFGKSQRYIQVGTVATDPDYRHQKLSRFLMEKVLADWRGKCDFIYLYANPSAVDVYPRFGFQKVKEYEYHKMIEKKSTSVEFEKLDMSMQFNRDKLYDYAKHSAVFGKVSMRENADLVMFSCVSFLPDHVYYIKSLDLIVVAFFKENQLHLWDVFGKKKVELDSVINILAHGQIDHVVLGFTPEDLDAYEVREFAGDDTLFIEQDKTKLFDENKIMFPLLSHA